MTHTLPVKQVSERTLGQTQILDMLSARLITLNEAERLLAATQPAPADSGLVAGTVWGVAVAVTLALVWLYFGQDLQALVHSMLIPDAHCAAVRTVPSLHVYLLSLFGGLR